MSQPTVKKKTGSERAELALAKRRRKPIAPPERVQTPAKAYDRRSRRTQIDEQREDSR